jgi:hypothetical protein
MAIKTNRALRTRKLISAAEFPRAAHTERTNERKKK